MQLNKERRIFARLGFTDMRKQIIGLSALVQELRPEGPFDGSYHVFCGNTRRVMKILYWDRTGFCRSASRRFIHKQKPFLSQYRPLIVVPRLLRNRNRFPEKGFSRIVPSANIAKVLMPCRPSVLPGRTDILVPLGSGIIRLSHAKRRPPL